MLERQAGRRCFRLQRYKLLKAIHNSDWVEHWDKIGCFRLQRYKLLKAIHNCTVQNVKIPKVVSDYKDTNFWKQFTTTCIGFPYHFRVVSDYKDTNFWKQFTTSCVLSASPKGCFRLQRYKLLKAIHNRHRKCEWAKWVVSDYKDTNFWKQFTTRTVVPIFAVRLFQTTKIQTFESNSQQSEIPAENLGSCFRLQRYKLLKAIHNIKYDTITSCLLFQTTKIQTFESNSQRLSFASTCSFRCFRLQRYKLLKAIHN